MVTSFCIICGKLSSVFLKYFSLLVSLFTFVVIDSTLSVFGGEQMSERFVGFMDLFGKRFRELRSEKGLTQEQLLKDFNKRYARAYTATAISYYENSKRIPETSALLDFAEYFNVTVSYLLGESDVRIGSRGVPVVTQSAEPFETDSAVTKKEQQILFGFRELNDRGQKKLFAYMDDLLTNDLNKKSDRHPLVAESA